MTKSGGMTFWGNSRKRSAEFFPSPEPPTGPNEISYGEHSPAFAKQGYSIVVDIEALNSVLEAPSPDEWTTSDYLRTIAYMNVLDMQCFDVQDEPVNGIGSEDGGFG